MAGLKKILLVDDEEDLREAIGRIARFLAGYRKRSGAAT